MSNLPFKERADAIRQMSEEIASAPILSRMSLATDLVARAADLVADMAAWIDAQQPYLDEDDAPQAFAAPADGVTDHAQPS